MPSSVSGRARSPRRGRMPDLGVPVRLVVAAIGWACRCLDVPFWFDCLDAERVGAIAGRSATSARGGPPRLRGLVHPGRRAGVAGWSDASGCTRVFGGEASRPDVGSTATRACAPGLTGTSSHCQKPGLFGGAQRRRQRIHPIASARPVRSFPRARDDRGVRHPLGHHLDRLGVRVDQHRVPPSAAATAPVVPLPAKKSSTRSPGLSMPARSGAAHPRASGSGSRSSRGRSSARSCATTHRWAACRGRPSRA